MKVTELMIGDWVYDTRETFNNPVKLTGINAHQINESDPICFLENEEGLGLTRRLSELKPIPLTAEILEKNDFVSVEEHRKHYTGNFDLSKYTHVMSWCENYFVAIVKVRDNCWNCHIQGNCANLDGGIGSVHHLQHALRTCEIEKIIVV